MDKLPSPQGVREEGGTEDEMWLTCVLKGPSVPVRTRVSPSFKIPFRRITSTVVPSPAITLT